MRTITGAILIFGAILLFNTALPYSAGGMKSGIINLTFILAGITAILGIFYLFAGSVEAKENSRWYQFTIKSLLAVTVMVALFFSGRALGLHETVTPTLPPVAYPSIVLPSTSFPPCPSPDSTPPTATWATPSSIDPYATSSAPPASSRSANPELSQPVSGSEKTELPTNATPDPSRK